MCADGSTEVERLLVDLLLAAVCDERDAEWLRSALAAAEAAPDPQTLARPYAVASRRLRAWPVAATPKQREVLEHAGLGAILRRGTATVFRAALLLTACRCAAERSRAGLIDRVVRTGDNEERVDVLRVLAALPSPVAYVATAVEACRSNVRDVFEAIACENDYPARYFSDDAFNQMVMKAVFTGVSLSRVRGLAARVNPELERMARDYSAERRAAGREIPADLSRLIPGQGEA